MAAPAQRHSLTLQTPLITEEEPQRISVARGYRSETALLPQRCPDSPQRKEKLSEVVDNHVKDLLRALDCTRELTTTERKYLRKEVENSIKPPFTEYVQSTHGFCDEWAKINKHAFNLTHSIWFRQDYRGDIEIRVTLKKNPAPLQRTIKEVFIGSIGYCARAQQVGPNKHNLESEQTEQTVDRINHLYAFLPRVRTVPHDRAGQVVLKKRSVLPFDFTAFSLNQRPERSKDIARYLAVQLAQIHEMDICLPSLTPAHLIEDPTTHLPTIHDFFRALQVNTPFIRSGEAGYICPEICFSEKQIRATPAMNMWSYGAILLTLIHKKNPFIEIQQKLADHFNGAHIEKDSRGRVFSRRSHPDPIQDPSLWKSSFLTILEDTRLFMLLLNEGKTSAFNPLLKDLLSPTPEERPTARGVIEWIDTLPADILT